MKSQIDTASAVAYTINKALTVTTASQSVTFYLYNSGIQQEALTIAVIKDGEKGDTGSTPNYVGEYDTMGNTSYVYNSSHRDIVSYKGMYFQVLTMGTSVTSEPPYTLSDGDDDGKWQVFNNFRALAADTALVNNASLAGFTFTKKDYLINNRIVGTLKSQNTDDSGQPMLSMDSETGELIAGNADIRGTVTAGDLNGKRIVLNPDSKSVSIYSEDNVEVAILDGTTYSSLESLFSGSGSGEISWSAGAVSGDPYTLVSTTATQTLASFTATSACQLTIKSITLSTSATCDDRLATTNTVSESRGYARLQAMVKVYDSSSMTTLLDSKQIGSVSATASTVKGNSSDSDKQSFSATFALPAGYVVVQVTYTIYHTADGATSVASWSDGTGTYATEFYVSRYFADGFCLGSRSDSYVGVINDDGIMRMRARCGDYGIDVSNNGVKSMVHASGSWGLLPSLIYKGRLTYSSSYTLTNDFTFDGSTPSVPSTVSTQGVIKFTMPKAWNSLLGTLSTELLQSRLIIHVIGSGGSNINYVKANIYGLTYSASGSYFTIQLSDDDSPNNANAMIDIWCI
jgi:hypothetical protein